MKNAVQAFTKLLEYTDVQSILDIGCGNGEHAKAFRAAGKNVTTVSLGEADYVGDYLSLRLSYIKYDAIWCSHVLEHQPNPNLFLRKCFADLADDGILAVTVPPLKHEIVGGHVTLWNSGLLLYHLILAGFDCSEARVSGEYDYNLSVIVRKKKAELPELRYDAGDIADLSKFFPFKAEHGFDGRLGPINW